MEQRFNSTIPGRFSFSQIYSADLASEMSPNRLTLAVPHKFHPTRRDETDPSGNTTNARKELIRCQL
ncbi:hypothetical protein BLNAU_11369 [Blattamonas nauphoetae]|uniref:Uncharacterized protein n=1 Tax=Blattamonas nauphoetae TaxID=2049346 RepID=A0ABQ9XML8_9EUKA|nr:hypothetical protein BLNAU_11369 [Blattamonas nauphoetae]